LSTGSDDTECGRDTLGEGFLTDVRRALVWHRYHAVSNRINEGGGGGHVFSEGSSTQSDYTTAAVQAGCCRRVTNAAGFAVRCHSSIALTRLHDRTRPDRFVEDT